MADTPIYQLPGVPKQAQAPGWDWDSAGVAGPTNPAPPYTEQERGQDQSYFGVGKFPASAEQYHGQDGKS